MSGITHYLKYAKYLEQDKRREDWSENVNRTRDMHIKKYPFLREEIQEIFAKFVEPKLVVPSMRSMQFGGLPIELNEARIFNCSYLLIDHWKSFREVMFLLISGTGVGYSVQYRHVSKLPSIRKPTRTKKYLIADDVIGWANAVEVLTKAYLDGGTLPDFDYRGIRKKGAPLKTSGGKAPGPEPLRKCLNKIKELFDSKDNGAKLTPLECHDVNCFIADAVLSGGIREAAMIAFFSPEDHEMARCKSNFTVKIIEESQVGDNYQVLVETNGWMPPKNHNLYLTKDQYEQAKANHTLPWWHFEPQRGRSNNSAMFIRNMHSIFDFKRLFKMIKESGAGEPGVFFSNDPDAGSNPCLTGDTQLLTKTGYRTLRELWIEGGKQEYSKDKNLDDYGVIEIINDKGLVRASNVFRTGMESEIYGVKFSNGSIIKATENHTFILSDGSRVFLKDLDIHDQVCTYNLDSEFGFTYPGSSNTNTTNRAYVESIALMGTDEVFCLNEPDSNTIVANGIIIGQCVEIALKPNQFCVSGDTKLITRDGLYEISSVVDKSIEIWNGEKWSKVTPFVTGTADTLYRVNFSDGSYLDATANHKFLVKNRFQKEYTEVETIDLIQALKESKYDLHVPPHSIICDLGTEEPLAYEYGFYLGDGYINGTKPYIALYGSKMHLKLKNMRSLGERVNPISGKHEIVAFDDCNRDLAAALRKKDQLPREIFSWDRNSIIGFISGWLDADGSNTPSGGARLYGAEGHIRDAQLLLSKIGIKSTVNLMSKAGEETNFGIRTRDMWYLQIVKTSDFICQRLECTNTGENLNKQKVQRVESVEQLPGLHMSYCFSEPELHQGVFNNVLTKQCNLCEVNVSNVESQQDLENRVRAAAFIGTLQAGYTDFHYLRDSWREATESEALLGVSMTGLASFSTDKYDLESAARNVVSENVRVAKIIGIKPAARTTCVKPAGTTSLIMGTSSGIHAWFSKYYTRRIRITKVSSVYSYLMQSVPQLMEDSVFDPTNTAYICVPMRAPDGAITEDSETALEFLGRLKYVTEHWIRPGHVSGKNTHNVSSTVKIKENEWDQVESWMWENRHSYSGIAVLPHDNNTYVQAPFEKISEEKYLEMLPFAQAIDFSQVKEIQDNTTVAAELACSSGVCQIV